MPLVYITATSTVCVSKEASFTGIIRREYTGLSTMITFGDKKLFMGAKTKIKLKISALTHKFGWVHVKRKNKKAHMLVSQQLINILQIFAKIMIEIYMEYVYHLRTQRLFIGIVYMGA